VRTIAEPLQVEMDNGTRRALVPLDNKRNFLEVLAAIVERIAPAFFSDATTAAMTTFSFALEFRRHLCFG
jgi:ATP-dependent Lon protease